MKKVTILEEIESIKVHIEQVSRQATTNKELLIEWKPTMKRLEDMSKPEGVFDKMTQMVNRHEESIENHTDQIERLENHSWKATVSLIGFLVTIIIFLIKEVVGGN